MKRSPGRFKGQEGLCKGHREDSKDRKDCADVIGKIQRTGRTVQKMLPGRFKRQEGLRREGCQKDPKDRKDCEEEVTGKIQRTGMTVKKRSPGKSNG